MYRKVVTYYILKKNNNNIKYTLMFNKYHPFYLFLTNLLVLLFVIFH